MGLDPLFSVWIALGVLLSLCGTSLYVLWELKGEPVQQSPCISSFDAPGIVSELSARITALETLLSQQQRPGLKVGTVSPGQFSPGFNQQVQLDTDLGFSAHSLSNFGSFYPAVLANGGIYSGGPLVVDGPVFYRTDDGILRRLDLLRTAVTGLPLDLQGDFACVHGEPSIFNDYSCICEPHWEGIQCDIHDCYNHGSYLPSSKTCQCTNDWLQSTMCGGRMCGDMLTTSETCDPPATSCTACVQGSVCRPSTNTCVCTGVGTFGPMCDQTCASITMTGCEGRNNWGHEFVTATFAVCPGGGYLIESETIVNMKGLRCPQGSDCQATFDQFKHICCSPAIDCSVLVGSFCAPTDLACCYLAAQSQETCLIAGCAWCQRTSGAGSCSPIGLTNLTMNCTAAETYDVTGDWVSWRQNCTTYSSNTVCDLATRAQWLAVYDSNCPSGYNTTCLLNAYAEVQGQSWPRLSTGYTNWLGYHTIALAQPQFLSTLPGCSGKPVLAVESVAGTAGAPLSAVWRCPGSPNRGDTYMQIQGVMDTTGQTAFQTAGNTYYVLLPRQGRVYCLVDSSLDTLRSVQMFNTRTTTPIAYFVDVTTLPLKGQCGEFRFDTVGLRTFDNRLGLGIGQPTSTRTAPATWGALALAVELSNGDNIVPW